MIRKSNREYTDRTPRKPKFERIKREPLAQAEIETPEGDFEAALVQAGVEDITISDILEAHDDWQAESPDNPDAIHDFVDRKWAAKRRKVDVG